MRASWIAVFLAVLLLAGPQRPEAQTKDILDQDWRLVPERSTLSLQTVKAKTVMEVHKFTRLAGTIARSGDARITLDLASIDSGHDLRDVRMRFLLFETFKFPQAEITAKLDLAKLGEIATSARVHYPLDVVLAMRGAVLSLQIPVSVLRVNEATVAVSTVKPVEISAESLGLSRNVAKLMETVGGTEIMPVAWVSFDLAFAGSAQPSPSDAEREYARVLRSAPPAGTGQTPAELDDALQRLDATLGGRNKRVVVRIGGGTRVHLGDRVLFDAVSNVAGRLAIIDINVDRLVTPLFPNHYSVTASIGRVTAGQQVVVPSSDYPDIVAFEAGEPTGKGYLIALLVPEDIDLEPYVVPPAHLQLGFAPVAEPSAYLARLIQMVAAAIAARERTGIPRGDELKRWGYSVTPYEIVP